MYFKGMMRKFFFVRVFMVMLKLVIFDELVSGLDIVNVYMIRKMIKSFVREEGVIFFVLSYNMFEVEFFCDRVVLINEGRIVELGILVELKEKYDVENFEEVFMRVVGVEILELVGGEGL